MEVHHHPKLPHGKSKHLKEIHQKSTGVLITPDLIAYLKKEYDII